MQSKTKKYHLIPTRKAKSKRHIVSVGDNTEKMEPLHLAGM